MKISETINVAGGNLARPTKFNAQIHPPMSLVQNFENKVFDVLCKTAGLPETINAPVEMIIKGHPIKIPGRTNQQNSISITFYLDENHSLRQIFYNWIAIIDKRFYGKKSQGATQAYENDDLYGDIILKVRDFAETLQEPMNYEIEHVFPTSVSGVEFNSSGNNEVMEFTVIFDFYRFSHISDDSDYDDELDSDLESNFSSSSYSNIPDMSYFRN